MVNSLPIDHSPHSIAATVIITHDSNSTADLEFQKEILMSVGATELSHPLVEHHLSGLREQLTPPAAFRAHLDVLATILAAEAMRALPTKPREIKTPMETMQAAEIDGRVAVVPILRAGLGMLEPFLKLLPESLTSSTRSNLQPTPPYQRASAVRLR